MNSLLHNRTDGGACLTVVEFGAEQTCDTRDGVTNASARAMVVQQVDETPAELALRATRRAIRLTRSGVPLEAGVIVAGDSVSDELFVCRCQTARAMIRAMRGARAPRLIFVAPSTISEASRHELFSIAGTLASQMQGSPIEVSVRFSERRLDSGLHPIVSDVTDMSKAAKPAFEPTAEVA
jgi:hypothetical protein